MKMFFAVVAFVPLLLGQGSAQILPCAAGCVSGVFANAASMGCAMNDMLCVCGKSTDFTDGIRDCVNQACPAADVAAQLPLAQSAGTDQCKTASAAAATPTATPAETQTQATPLTQQAAASSPTTTPTEATAETTGAAATSTPVSTPTAQTTEAALSVASTDSSATSATSAAGQSSTGSAASDMSSTTDSGAAGGATAAADNSDSGSSSTSSDLSVAARAGIGAGSGVAAVLLGIIAFCLITRRRKQKKAAQHAKSMQISQPLPGSGRLYAGNMSQADASLSKTFTPSPLSSKKSNQPVPRVPSPTTPPYSPSVASSYDPELDLNARRYEDLTPRTQPRTMI
ncbi:hypothetical protein F4805DRAFT_265848 [Annulohypoxylon moriforme]|nr:hypothetical protein F4805DRAFT_265848 [Annulohypoxylon moriforme]